MPRLRLILLLLALVCYLVACLPMVSPYALRLIAVGLACATAAQIDW